MLLSHALLACMTQLHWCNPSMQLQPCGIVVSDAASAVTVCAPGLPAPSVCTVAVTCFHPCCSSGPQQRHLWRPQRRHGCALALCPPHQQRAVRQGHDGPAGIQPAAAAPAGPAACCSTARSTAGDQQLSTTEQGAEPVGRSRCWFLCVTRCCLCETCCVLVTA